MNIIAREQKMADKIDTGSINKFNGLNYNQWRFQILCALRAKGIQKLVTGDDHQPADPGNPILLQFLISTRR